MAARPISSVGHVALPGDVDGQEEPREPQEAEGRVVDDELLRELGDRDDQDEVEEELEPGRVPLAGLLRRRQQPRRREPARPAALLSPLPDADAHSRSAYEGGGPSLSELRIGRPDSAGHALSVPG